MLSRLSLPIIAAIHTSQWHQQVTNPNGTSPNANQSPSKVYDGLDTTKWVDTNAATNGKSTLQFTFAANTQASGIRIIGLLVASPLLANFLLFIL